MSQFRLGVVLDTNSKVSNKRAGKTGARDVVVRVRVLIVEVLWVIEVVDVFVVDVVTLLLVVRVKVEDVKVVVDVEDVVVFVCVVCVESVSVSVSSISSSPRDTEPGSASTIAASTSPEKRSHKAPPHILHTLESYDKQPYQVELICEQEKEKIEKIIPRTIPKL